MIDFIRNNNNGVIFFLYMDSDLYPCTYFWLLKKQIMFAKAVSSFTASSFKEA